MPTPQSASSSPARKSSRPASKARNELLTQLKEDHQRVKKAYNKYRRLDAREDAETRQKLVQLVLDELSVHARLEEELLYPAAREQLDDSREIDEAQVEHEMLHILIDQLRDLDPEDETHEEEQHARFTVLCEYTLHHVKEEERDMFPQLMKAKLDWLGLARDFEERRAELKGESEDEEDAPEAGTEEEAGLDEQALASLQDEGGEEEGEEGRSSDERDEREEEDEGREPPEDEDSSAKQGRASPAQRRGASRAGPASR